MLMIKIRPERPKCLAKALPYYQGRACYENVKKKGANKFHSQLSLHLLLPGIIIVSRSLAVTSIDRNSKLYEYTIPVYMYRGKI